MREGAGGHTGEKDTADSEDCRRAFVLVLRKVVMVATLRNLDDI